MPDLPPSLTGPAAALRGRALRLAAFVVVAGAAAASIATGCADQAGRARLRSAPGFYPPQPQEPCVIGLGTLRGNGVPSEAEIRLSQFFFGADPPPQLAIANPTGLAALPDGLLVCDSILHLILHWDAQTGRISEVCQSQGMNHPFAIDVTPEGERFICDRSGVLRCDGVGEPRRVFDPPPDAAYKPVAALAVGDEVWVANHAANRIEVYDRATEQHVRALGRQGTGPGEFALPRSMARLPDGHIAIVDMLNCRVQVVDRDGKWVRNIGQPGDAIGCFGRPKDVAVGPDGVVFVTDAFSQRVHAFAPDGQPLLAFGEPGSGIGALAMPNGIAVTPYAPRAERTLPSGAQPAYYVLVAEQLDRPGVRIYAWLDVDVAMQPYGRLPSGQALDWTPQFPESSVINPHWHPQRCDTCHTMERGAARPIPLARVDALCLSCHDGVQAPADPHPIGRPAETSIVNTPDDWPTVEGEIICLTCHDVLPHCDRAAERPAVNSVLLRGFDPLRPLEYCANCHIAEATGRFSPHRQRDDQGRIRQDACLFCHTEIPAVPDDGRRQFEPKLRTESSDLCLNCHTPHWDLSPKGHVDRPVTPAIRQWMLMRELGREIAAPPETLARMAADLDRAPARVPLGDDKVTCYSCHNPHYLGLFPEDSELGALARNPADRRAALRTDWIDLCSECHHH